MSLIDAVFISLPAEGDREKAFKDLSDGVNKSSIAINIVNFGVPVNIKTETLDKLVTLQDRYRALEAATESTIRKFVQYMADMLEEQRKRLEENLVVNGSSTKEYVSNFAWDAAKFPSNETLQLLLERADAIVGRIENEFRSRTTTYNNLRNSLQAMERKQGGSLLTRNLVDIVKKDQFVLDSEYLVTVLVVVPRHAYPEWQSSYENLVDMVVPRSSELVFEDQEYGLWTVTLFQKMLSDFSQQAIEEEKMQLEEARAEKKKVFPALFRFLKINFGELFITLAHIKSLKLFVESIMRYGLPVDFMTAIIVVPRKNVKKLRDLLMIKYQHLDTVAARKSKDDGILLAGVVKDEEYYPYVSITLETDIEPH
nr:V type proton ATPase subunit C 1 A [Hymenolepis microstoma]